MWITTTRRCSCCRTKAAVMDPSGMAAGGMMPLDGMPPMGEFPPYAEQVGPPPHGGPDVPAEHADAVSARNDGLSDRLRCEAAADRGLVFRRISN